MALCRYAAQDVEADWRPHAGGRRPPLPFWRGKDCPICGFDVFAGGGWRAADGPKRGTQRWHGCCTQFYLTMRDYNDQACWLAGRQDWCCPVTGEPLRVQTKMGAYLLQDLEVDHVVPLWRVRRDWAQHRWPDVLRFWLPGNLQAVSQAGHRIKTAREAAERAGRE